MNPSTPTSRPPEPPAPSSSLPPLTSRPPRPARVAVAVAAVGLALAGCGTHTDHTGSDPTPPPTTSAGPAPTSGSTGSTRSASRTTTPTPPPSHAGAPAADAAVLQADRAFWAAYADDDAETACGKALGYAHGQVVAMSGSFLEACVDSLGAFSPAGTSLSIRNAVVFEDAIAFVDVTGRVCGAEGARGGGCVTVPDLRSAMPASSNADDVEAALSAIVHAWDDPNAAGWTPDILVNVQGTWRPLLPVPDPVADPTPTRSQGSSGGGGGAPAKKPWTDDDWRQTCASGGCGSVPGLPPFHPGGGLKF